MTKKRRRPIHLHVMVSEEELALIRERMAEAGIRNMGAYMRKMALNGYVRHVGHLLMGELVLARPVFQRESNILPYRQMGIQGVILEHQPHAPVLRRQVGDVVVAEEDTAGGRLLQSGEQVQRGGLAAARRANEGGDGVFGDVEVKPRQRMKVTVPKVEILGRNGRLLQRGSGLINGHGTP